MEATEDMRGENGNNSLELSDQERAAQEEEWMKELEKVEEEVKTLKQVLEAKQKRVADLKRLLGKTPLKEMQQDLTQGVQKVRESQAYKDASEKIIELTDPLTKTQAYQASSSAIKSASEKTWAALTPIGASVGKKFGELKNSTAFKSFEGKVGTAYHGVKRGISEHSISRRLSGSATGGWLSRSTTASSVAGSGQGSGAHPNAGTKLDLPSAIDEIESDHI